MSNTTRPQIVTFDTTPPVPQDPDAPVCPECGNLVEHEGELCDGCWRQYQEQHPEPEPTEAEIAAQRLWEYDPYQ